MISREQAFQNEFMLPEKVRKHCRKVNEVVMFLADKGKSRQLAVDMDVIDPDVQVNHDKVVPAETRWNKGMKRYNIPYEEMVLLELFLALEKELCATLFAPEYLFNERRGMPT